MKIGVISESFRKYEKNEFALTASLAKKVGASGGTVLNARGTANKEAESFFGITIQPEKEIVMIVVPAPLKEQLLNINN